jgi:hypothetical protein
MRHALKLGYAFVCVVALQSTIGCNDAATPTTTPDTTIVNGVTVDNPEGLPPSSLEEQATPYPTEGNPAAKPGVEGTPAVPSDNPVPLPTEGNPDAVPGVEGAPPSTTDDDQSMTEEIRASLASLSAEDRTLAEKQKICPVGEMPLGSMGSPVKVTVAGHNVLLCCEHCEAPLKAEPEKYLAKIGLKPEDAAAQ